MLATCQDLPACVLQNSLVTCVSRVRVLVICVSFACILFGVLVDSGLLYSFGLNQGDRELPRGTVSTSPQVPLDLGCFPFGSKRHSAFHVSMKSLPVHCGHLHV